MINKGYKSIKSLIYSSLNSIKYSKLQKMRLWAETALLFLTINGRINFLQLERYGKSCERRYRDLFARSFDFLAFNIKLAQTYGSGNFVLGFDPSYISKSGKKTPGVGYFWSGSAGRVKWGLELVGCAAIDLDNHTAFHLEAIQTKVETNTDTKLTQFYSKIIRDRQEQFKKISKYLVADAWFSKLTFVQDVLSMDMHLVSRLRDDANLKYLAKPNVQGEKKQQGRPRKYDGKIDHKSPNMRHFELIQKDETKEIRVARVYSVALKMEILLVHVFYFHKDDKLVHKLYFSTDLELEPIKLLNMYSARFQIEFIYRDGKQHTGLNHCQARSEDKLHFHFNMSLTAVNLAKVHYWLSLDKNERGAFSLDNIKRLSHNEMMLDLFLTEFGINPNLKKNRKKVRKLLNYGTRAA